MWGVWQLSVPMTNINCVQKLVYIIQILFPIHSIEQRIPEKLKLAYLVMKFHSLYRNWEFIFVFKTKHYWNQTRAKQIMLTPSYSISLKNLHYVRALKTITLKKLQTFRRESRLMSGVCLIFFYKTMINKIRVITSNHMEQSPLLTVRYSCDPAESTVYSDSIAVIKHILLLTLIVQLWYRRDYCLQWWYSCDPAESIAYSDSIAAIQQSLLLTVTV